MRPSKNSTVFAFFEELQQPFLDDLSSTAYSMLQSLFTSSKGVLWLSAGGGLSQEEPGFAVINGLFRVLRNEQ